MLRVIPTAIWGSWENVPLEEKLEIYKKERARDLVLDAIEDNKIKVNAWYKAVLHYENGGTVRECSKMLGITPAVFNQRLEILSAAGVLKRKPRPSTFLQNLINKFR